MKKPFLALGLSVSLACLQFANPVFAAEVTSQDPGISQTQSGIVEQASSPTNTDAGVPNPPESNVPTNSNATSSTPVQTDTSPTDTQNKVVSPEAFEPDSSTGQEASKVPEQPAKTTTPSAIVIVTQPQEVKYKAVSYDGQIIGNYTVDFLLNGDVVATVSSSGVTNAKEISSEDRFRLKPRVQKGSKGHFEGGFKLVFDTIAPLQPAPIPPVNPIIPVSPVNPVISDGSTTSSNQLTESPATTETPTTSSSDEQTVTTGTQTSTSSSAITSEAPTGTPQTEMQIDTDTDTEASGSGTAITEQPVTTDSPAPIDSAATSSGSTTSSETTKEGQKTPTAPSDSYQIPDNKETSIEPFNQTSTTTNSEIKPTSNDQTELSTPSLN